MTNEIRWPTEEEKYRGYQLCPCGVGVHLLNSGFDIQMIMCRHCMREVAYVDDFKLKMSNCKKLASREDIERDLRGSIASHVSKLNEITGMDVCSIDISFIDTHDDERRRAAIGFVDIRYLPPAD